jgi:hypothetical protein
MSKFVVVICFIVFIWVATAFLSYHFPFSKNYYKVNSDSELIDRYNFYSKSGQHAINDLKKWTNESERKTKLFNNLDTNNSFCVAIVSKERLGYPNMKANTIIASVTSLITRINLKHEDKVNIVVLNVDKNKQREDLLILSDLVQIVDIENPYGYSMFELQNPKVREMSDYIFILSWLYKRSCKYTLILEDDAIATFNWYEKTIDAINKLNSYTNDWFSLKLFVSFGKFDWIFDIDSVIRSVLFVFLFTLTQSLFLSYLINFLNNGSCSFNVEFFYSRGTLNLRNIPRKCILLIFFHTILFKLYLNSTSITPLGTGVREFLQGFNLVASVYPNDQLNLMSIYLETFFKNYLKNNMPGNLFIPKDELLKSYIKENHLREFVVQPSFFQHIGVFSSLSVRGPDLKSLQNFNFESYSFEANMKPIVFDKNIYDT